MLKGLLEWKRSLIPSVSSVYYPALLIWCCARGLPVLQRPLLATITSLMLLRLWLPASSYNTYQRHPHSPELKAGAINIPVPVFYQTHRCLRIGGLKTTRHFLVKCMSCDLMWTVLDLVLFCMNLCHSITGAKQALVKKNHKTLGQQLLKHTLYLGALWSSLT